MNLGWLSSVLDGSVAAVLSLLGVYLVFRATTRRDRAREEERARREDDLARQRDQDAAIAELVTALNMQVSDLAFTPLYESVRGHIRVNTAVVRFALALGADAPHMTSWVLYQFEQMQAARHQMRRQRWLALVGRDHSSDFIAAIGSIQGEVTAWRLGRRSDAWFRDQLDHLQEAGSAKNGR